MVEVREYLDQNGRSPFADWFDGLDARAAAKVNTARTQQLGKLVKRKRRRHRSL
jgi:hypothetical protein